MFYRFIKLLALLIFVLINYSAISATANTVTLRDRDEIYVLALNIYYEARGEPTEGKIAVAQVVFNRIHDGRYPTTVRGVVTQRRDKVCQFTWVCRVGLKKPPNNEDWIVSQRLAEYVYYNHQNIEDYSDGSLFFERKSNRIRRNYNVIINNHVFY